MNEIGKEKDTGIVRVKVDEKFFRPTEVVSVKSHLIYDLCLDFNEIFF